ncbi:MAG: hypothetical protein M1818_002309 [Claussenomyces sp. TS43310]|nr:MAG: hypothetical protein M1818_002309 [Claussenomyces sp. TS43310]
MSIRRPDLTPTWSMRQLKLFRALRLKYLRVRLAASPSVAQVKALSEFDFTDDKLEEIKADVHREALALGIQPAAAHKLADQFHTPLQLASDVEDFIRNIIHSAAKVELQDDAKPNTPEPSHASPILTNKQARHLECRKILNEKRALRKAQAADPKSSESVPTIPKIASQSLLPAPVEDAAHPSKHSIRETGLLSDRYPAFWIEATSITAMAKFIYPANFCGNVRIEIRVARFMKKKLSPKQREFYNLHGEKRTDSEKGTDSSKLSDVLDLRFRGDMTLYTPTLACPIASECYVLRYLLC